MIELKGITKEYRTGDVVTPVLRGVDLKIERGEYVAIRGVSGSGKSTLMHIIGLLDRPTSGQYLYDRVDISKMDDEALARLRNQKIGFVFQAFYLLPRTSVLENVMLPVVYSPTGVVNGAPKERALELLKRVGLSHRANNMPNQISGGEMQRVAVARALMNEPDFILADEPTGNLDVANSEIVLKIFRELHEAGKTIVMVTHEDEVAREAKRVIHVRDGKVVQI